MQTVKIHPELYNGMVTLYANTVFRKLYKEIHKQSEVLNIACKTASEFDKAIGIIGVDNIVDFVTLQIILRLTSFNDTYYNKDIEDNKDNLICETGITFDIDNSIEEYTFNDVAVIKAVNDIAATKMMKLQDVYDDNIVYLTKAFCKVMCE